MQSKGVVRFFLIALTLVCLYQYALIIPTNNIENDAARYADDCAKNPNTTWRTCYSGYLDSLSSETVFEIPLIKKFTYADLKKSQLAMGLDLKGGMSVLLQVDLRDFLISLSGNSTDPALKEALDKASQAQITEQTDYITLFAEAWKTSGNGKSLASVFARNESLKGQINFESPDQDVLRVVRELANTTVNETYKRLKQRIDKLGVVQPNVSLDAARDLILVELPGIDNPKRARDMLQKSAKLEFWDTYRIGDEGLSQALVSADTKLRTTLSGDTSILPVTVKDTTYVYPTGPDGLPDSTATPEMQVVDRPVEGAQSAGPLLTQLTPAGDARSVVIGYADKNKRDAISQMLSRPEIRALFPVDLKFLWSLKPVDESDGVSSTTSGKYELYAIKKWRNQDKARLDGSVVTRASEQPDPNTGEVTVSLAMNNEGARIWADMTKAAYEGGNREIAIVLDDEVVSAPRVINPIESGSSSITGGFTLEEARDLANILEVGKLPAGTRIVQESQVGPSLGADNINKSMLAFALSVFLICAFMIAYYAKGGIISVIALLANIFFIIGTLASMGTVLTLPGIAGIVLTLATAVDANVIIYERIREELRDGLTSIKAINTGFSRALPAIIDANVTTLLTAFILMYFGLGPIKGFGTVLMIGIFSSLFTAVLVGRLMTEWWINRGTEMTYSLPWSANWLVNANFDWIGKRKWAYLFSAAITLVGIGSFFTRGFELGVDFKGGYSFNVQFDQPVSLDGLRPALNDALGGNPIVKSVSTENTYNITTSYLINDQGEDVMDRVIAKLHEGIQNAGITTDLDNFSSTDGTGTHITSSSQVGPTVADDIRSSSYKATIWALLLIFLYLLVRFRRWQFSMGAVIALFHDALITLTFFTLLHGIVPFSLEIDQAIIACILTVIGFSVNDTVIVYDRIREFINTYAGRPKAEVFNLAINTTLSRTLITSGTTLAAALMLFLFGGDAIKGFSFGMSVGVLFGTYSSIFVASALVVDMTKEDILSGKSVEAQPKTSSYAKKAKDKASSK
ncbi:MAG: protein translocase subunit SecDF [Bacteroidetes bacterium]|nr:MAG: protein translocase subunit SecDF [Bacteroidota bacterium]